MPQQPDSATPTRICKVSAVIGQKVRLAGRMLSYDATTGMIVLIEGKSGVVVDVSLCLGSSARWVRERLSKIIVIGHAEDAKSVAEIGGDGGEVEIDRGVVVRAVLVVPAAELDLKLWNKVVEEGERTPGLSHAS